MKKLLIDKEMVGGDVFFQVYRDLVFLELSQTVYDLLLLKNTKDN
jgi:hypothetical protein